MNGELTDVVFDGDRISMGVANTDFTRMKIKAAAIEASARNDYASNMICIMHSDGYKVAPWHPTSWRTASARSCARKPAKLSGNKRWIST